VSGPRYPGITVKLTGRDGNVHNLIGLVVRALRAASVPQQEIDEFLTQVRAGDYDNALRVMMAWVEVS
jgi:hypothetical protein